MSEVSWAATRRTVYERAQGYCEYCQSHEDNTGQAMHVEHIDPAGGDGLDNLCLACPTCNFSKAVATTAPDPETQHNTPLFNPRTQHWPDHFEWIDGGLRIQGKTPTGRATVERLQINQERVVRARRNWVTAGTHPPP